LWTAATASDPASSPDTANGVSISNCRIRHDLADPVAAKTYAAGIVIAGWTDVTVQCVDVVGAMVGLYVSGAGSSSDDTVRRVRVSGTRMRGVRHGVYGTTGVIEDLHIIGCDIDAWDRAIFLGGPLTRGLIASHSRFRKLATGRGTDDQPCIDVRRMSDARFEHCVIEGTAVAFYAQPDTTQAPVTSQDNVISSCTLRLQPTLAKFFIRLDDGLGWRIFNNVLDGPFSAPSLFVPGERAVYVQIAHSIRAISALRPEWRGCQGDVVLATDRRSSEMGWSWRWDPSIQREGWVAFG
jgi:hypothetical protein